jgi:hypothetical protein
MDDMADLQAPDWNGRTGHVWAGVPIPSLIPFYLQALLEMGFANHKSLNFAIAVDQ